jgi:hypothetical protein
LYLVPQVFSVFDVVFIALLVFTKFTTDVKPEEIIQVYPAEAGTSRPRREADCVPGRGQPFIV